VSKIASIKNVQNNVQKHSIKNGVLKSVEYFVGNKLSKRMSKWYQYKCQKPSC
jgi:antitoxin component YwqK of YwqJK toxin-antitoxin module